MAKKPLKPPFYLHTATCHIHGTVTVERKPHPQRGQRTDAGAIQSPTYRSIVCPHCTYHAAVTGVEFIPGETCD